MLHAMKWALVGVLWLLPLSAAGQDLPAIESPVEAAQGPGQAEAAILSDLALAHVRERKVEGWVLLSWGLANVAAGAVIAGVGNEDDTWLFAGLTTSAWGLINAGLSLLLLDLGGGRETGAREIRALRGQPLLDAQNDLVDGQRGSAAIFALNAGLDVAYILAGVLLYALGEAQTPEEPWMLAVGGTAIVQGAALLVFDLFNWFGSNARADALRAAIP